MIYVSDMSEVQALAAIQQLAKEVKWSSDDLLHQIHDWNESLQNENLESSLQKVKSHGDLKSLLTHLIDTAPFHIELRDTDHKGCVTITTLSKILAHHDQSIAGAMWECPDDMDIAYAMPCNYPGLLEELKRKNYTVNDDNYSPPDELKWDWGV